MAHIPFFYWGLLFVLLGFSVHVCGVVLAVLLTCFPETVVLRQSDQWLFWSGGLPTLLGLLLACVDLVLMLPRKRRGNRQPPPPPKGLLTVVLTAYNDEQSIGGAVRDFLSRSEVERVIVVSNNSSDETSQVAAQAGAIVVEETQQGYGRCVHRCYTEALRWDDAQLILLCGGDSTFRADDIPKFLAYLPHAEIVNGTRIVEQLRAYSTQLSTFMYYGNFFVGKLLEVKHLGRGTFTDVGTTYKLLRRPALERVLEKLNPAVNLEFNAHFLDVALASGVLIVECPVTFHPRVGMSKGGNTNNWQALQVGLRMIWGLSFGWRRG
jgi:glycosyltransferase involved in cell wall biosynthesis